MCPVCIATAMLLAGSVTSTGGLAAIALKKIGISRAADPEPAPTESQSKEDRHG